MQTEENKNNLGYWSWLLVGGLAVAVLTVNYLSDRFSTARQIGQAAEKRISRYLSGPLPKSFSQRVSLPGLRLPGLDSKDDSLFQTERIDGNAIGGLTTVIETMYRRVKPEVIENPGRLSACAQSGLDDLLVLENYNISVITPAGQPIYVMSGAVTEPNEGEVMIQYLGKKYRVRAVVESKPGNYRGTEVHPATIEIRINEIKQLPEKGQPKQDDSGRAGIIIIDPNLF